MRTYANELKQVHWLLAGTTGSVQIREQSDVATLSMAVDSQPLFRRGVPRLLSSRENERIDGVFQALFSEANLVFCAVQPGAI